MTKSHTVGKIPALNQIQGSLIVAVVIATFFAPLIKFDQLRQASPALILGIFYLGFLGSILSYMAYYSLLRNVSAVSVSVIFLVTPLISIALGWKLNNEHYTGADWAGIALVIVGLAAFASPHQKTRTMLK